MSSFAAGGRRRCMWCVIVVTVVVIAITDIHTVRLEEVFLSSYHALCYVSAGVLQPYCGHIKGNYKMYVVIKKGEHAKLWRLKNSERKRERERERERERGR